MLGTRRKPKNVPFLYSVVILKQVKVGPMENFAYVLGDEATRTAAVVDPGFEPARLADVAKEMGLAVTHVLLTHAHFDHAQSASALAGLTGAKIVAHAASVAPHDESVKDGDEIRVGNLCIRVVHTPGHEPSSVCFVVDGHVLTGDTLFVGECGRVDLPGSDPEEMYESLLHRLAKLPKELVVLPGHDYGKTPTSTLAREFRENHVLKPRTKEEFLDFIGAP